MLKLYTEKGFDRCHFLRNMTLFVQAIAFRGAKSVFLNRYPSTTNSQPGASFWSRKRWGEEKSAVKSPN